MKNIVIFVVLIGIIVLLLAVRIGGCQLFPEIPTGTTSSGASDTTAGSETGNPTTTASESEAPTTTASESSAPTSIAPTTQATTLTPTTSAPISNISHGWFFVTGDPTGHDKPATVPNDVSELIDGYDVIWQKPIAGRKVVYLTMDNGYEFNNNTASILDTAKDKQVPITFFVIGSYIENNPDLVKRMVEEGHTVANHSYTHPDSVKMLDEKGEEAFLADIRRLETAFRDLTGREIARLYRTPSGIYSERLLYLMTREGYRTVFWSFAYQDWLTDDQPDPEKAKARILNQLHDGSVILLHAVSNTNTEILPELIDGIRARGYEFARLEEAP